MGQLRLIMRAVPRAGCEPYAGTEGFLIYAHKFNLVHSSPDSAAGMYLLKRARRSDNSLVGDIVPLDQLRAAIDLTPRFGAKADTRLTTRTILEYSTEFWLNKYFSKELFFALSDK